MAASAHLRSFWATLTSSDAEVFAISITTSLYQICICATRVTQSGGTCMYVHWRTLLHTTARKVANANVTLPRERVKF